MALVLWITRRATRPLRDLERAARRVAEGDLQAEVREGGAEELDAVARSFNAMVRQLARRDRIAREFLMRVTHDLRTPLTRLRLRIERTPLRCPTAWCPRTPCPGPSGPSHQRPTGSRCW